MAQDTIETLPRPHDASEWPSSPSIDGGRQHPWGAALQAAPLTVGDITSLDATKLRTEPDTRGAHFDTLERACARIHRCSVGFSCSKSQTL